MFRKTILALTFFTLVAAAFAQEPAAPAREKGKAGGGGYPARPPLFLKEEWKQIPGGGEHAIAPGHLANPNLELKLYGESGKDIQVTGLEGNDSNPVHAWTGLCEKPCALALRDKKNFADLTGLSRLRWVTKMSGFHQVRPIIKLADGTWLVGDKADGSITDWLETELSFADMRWLKLNINKLVTNGTWVDKPDLSKVDEIGFVDLMPSSGHGPGGWADVGKIEVYAKPVPR
jgi:hypothetical protein